MSPPLPMPAPASSRAAWRTSGRRWAQCWRAGGQGAQQRERRRFLRHAASHVGWHLPLHCLANPTAMPALTVALPGPGPGPGLPLPLLLPLPCAGCAAGGRPAEASDDDCWGRQCWAPPRGCRDCGADAAGDAALRACCHPWHHVPQRRPGGYLIAVMECGGGGPLPGGWMHGRGGLCGSCSPAAACRYPATICQPPLPPTPSCLPACLPP